MKRENGGDGEVSVSETLLRVLPFFSSLSHAVASDREEPYTHPPRGDSEGRKGGGNTFGLICDCRLSGLVH